MMSYISNLLQIIYMEKCKAFNKLFCASPAAFIPFVKRFFHAAKHLYSLKPRHFFDANVQKTVVDKAVALHKDAAVCHAQIHALALHKRRVFAHQALENVQQHVGRQIQRRQGHCPVEHRAFGETTVLMALIEQRTGLQLASSGKRKRSVVVLHKTVENTSFCFALL